MQTSSVLSSRSEIFVDGALLEATKMVTLQQVQQTLEQHYPGHAWVVGINDSIIIVRNTLLAGDYGYVIHIPAIYSASWLADEVMRAGGEILERYRQRRARVEVDSIIELPTDFAGRHKPEL